MSVLKDVEFKDILWFLVAHKVKRVGLLDVNITTTNNRDYGYIFFKDVKIIEFFFGEFYDSYQSQIFHKGKWIDDLINEVKKMEVRYELENKNKLEKITRNLKLKNKREIKILKTYL